MLDKIINAFLVHAAIVLPLVVLLALLVSSTARDVLRLTARITARLLLIGAIIALAYDGTRSFSGGSGLIATSLSEHWSNLSPSTLEAAHKAISARLGPAAWDMVLVPLLRWPAWLVAGVLALILSWFGRRRPEVSIFVN